VTPGNKPSEGMPHTLGAIARLSIIPRGGTILRLILRFGLSGAIPIRGFTARANFRVAVLFPRKPLVPTSFTAIAPQLNLRCHMPDIFPPGI